MRNYLLLLAVMLTTMLAIGQTASDGPLVITVWSENGDSDQVYYFPAGSRAEVFTEETTLTITTSNGRYEYANATLLVVYPSYRPEEPDRINIKRGIATVYTTKAAAEAANLTYESIFSPK